MKKIFFASFVLTALVLSGCNQEAPPQTVCVDLDRVAQATGWRNLFQTATQKKEQELQGQINSAKQQLEEQINKLKEEFGMEMTDEQKTQMFQYTQQANNRMGNLMNSAKQINNQYKAGLISHFHEQIRPYVKEVAEGHGASVVMLKADPLFILLPDADITDDVIKALDGVSLNTDLPKPPAAGTESESANPTSAGTTGN